MFYTLEQLVFEKETISDKRKKYSLPIHFDHVINMMHKDILARRNGIIINNSFFLFFGF